MIDAVTDDDIKALVKALVDEAKTGDVRAASAIFNRLIGRPTDAPSQVESAGVQYTPITTTPEQLLGSLTASEARDYDPYCGIRPDDASPIGRRA